MSSCRELYTPLQDQYYNPALAMSSVSWPMGVKIPSVNIGGIRQYISSAVLCSLTCDSFTLQQKKNTLGQIQLAGFLMAVSGLFAYLLQAGRTCFSKLRIGIEKKISKYEFQKRSCLILWPYKIKIAVHCFVQSFLKCYWLRRDQILYSVWLVFSIVVDCTADVVQVLHGPVPITIKLLEF